MLKPIATILVGAVPAAAATYYLWFADRSPEPTPPAAAPLTSTAGPLPGIEPDTSPDSDRLAAFHRAADIDEPAELELLLSRSLAEPFSPSRETEIVALFKRLAAVDLGRALRIAETPGFDARLVADVVQALAEDDAGTALAVLAAVRNQAQRLEIAVALLDVLGYQSGQIERVAAALPANERIDFQAEALARLAATDAIGAIGAALSLTDTGARNAATQRVGIAWARHDPIGALSRGEFLPTELRDAYHESVSREWVRIDAAAFLDYADSQPRLDDLLPALMYAIGVDSERTFEIASRHPPLPIGDNFAPNVTVERWAFQAMVSRDPEETLDLLGGMAESRRKRELMSAFAEAYAGMAPREAMAWARSVEPPNPSLEATVITYAARNDVDQALRWLHEYEGPVAASSIAYTLGLLAAAESRRAEIASDLRAQDNPNAQAVLMRLTQVWMLTDPAGVFDWMVSTDASIDPALAANVGRTLAARNAAAAADYADRVPDDVRGTWLEQVARYYGSQDPAGAANWIARIQGEPGYDGMLQQLVQQAAAVDPESAAQMLQFATGDLQQNTAARVASAWAAQDLARAAQWATSLGNESTRNVAVGQVATAWATRNPQAAQRWATGLPRGEMRDQALSSVLRRLGRDSFISAVDWRLLGNFDSAAERDGTASSLVGALAYSDPDRVRSLADRWIENPVLRQQAEEAIEQARGL